MRIIFLSTIDTIEIEAFDLFLFSKNLCFLSSLHYREYFPYPFFNDLYQTQGGKLKEVVSSFESTLTQIKGE